MQTQNVAKSRIRRTVNDLVMLEMFFVQATIESATVISEGLNALGKQISSDDNDDDASGGSGEPISAVLQRVADGALEPYTSRFRYFRSMINSEN